MRQPVRMAVRFFVIVAVLAAVSTVLPSNPARSPYVSSLSDLSVNSALAQASCNNRHCSHNGKGGPKCAKGGINLNCTVSASSCTTVMCV